MARQQSLTVVALDFDCQKALLNGHHDGQYLDLTTLPNFNSFTTFSKTIFAIS